LTLLVTQSNFPPMPINPRILRAEADDLDDFSPRFRTARESARHDHILKVAQVLLARYGRHELTFTALALALRIGTATLRRHFIDLDALLGDILNRHLMDLARYLGQIPFNDPDRDRKRRAKYLEYTRNGFGGLTQAHLLFVRDRHTLPEDLLTALEQTRDGIGASLGPDPQETLALLDTQIFTLPCIEVMLAALDTLALQQTPAPETQPAEPAPAATRTKPGRPRATPKPRPQTRESPATFTLTQAIPPTAQPPPGAE